MCIYCGTNYHRLIYENHFGPIPVDEDGRSYEIHHIDGNHSNNSLDNLLCVSVEEHYRIHNEQGDTKACLIMSQRIKISPEEKSRLAKISNAGERNPSFGTMWITNEIENKKIKKGNYIPDGWREGRVFSEDHAAKFTKRSKKGKRNTRYNHSKFLFVNTLTSEKVLATPHEFSLLKSINIKRIRGLHKRRIENLGEWIIDFNQ